MESKILLGKTKQTIKTVKEAVDFESFKSGINQYKPSGIVHPWYSMSKPAWVITEYVDQNTLKYYANGWADKTPKEISIEDFYKEMKRQGIEECYFFTNVGEQVAYS